jgi:DNA-directed RNA polymerase subunit M/transcription elongation factor TFIIS
MRFCPKCRGGITFKFGEPGIPALTLCSTCGHKEPFVPKTLDEALLMETKFHTGSSASSAASGITINAYTLQDPTLPHVTTLRCPGVDCPAERGETSRDVIFIKTDPAALKFQYICTRCNTQWTN